MLSTYWGLSTTRMENWYGWRIIIWIAPSCLRYPLRLVLRFPPTSRAKSVASAPSRRSIVRAVSNEIFGFVSGRQPGFRHSVAGARPEHEFEPAATGRGRQRVFHSDKR